MNYKVSTVDALKELEKKNKLRFIEVMKHGSMTIEFFKPKNVHIENAVADLRANTMGDLQEELLRAITRLEELLANLTNNPEKVDSTLADIEKLLERAMLTNWDKQHLKVLEKEVAGQLRGYKAEMDADAYKNTFRLMLIKRLREEAGIPRLGLYYL